MSNNNLQNHRIQAEACMAPVTECDSLSRHGHTLEDLWFLEHDRELIKKLKAESCKGCEGCHESPKKS